MGQHNLSNILAAVATGLALNIPAATIKEGISELTSIPGRLQKIENGLGFQVFVDYAHTDQAMRSLLETIRDLKPHRIILVFGAGGDRDKSKRPQMGRGGRRARRPELSSLPIIPGPKTRWPSSPTSKRALSAGPGQELQDRPGPERGHLPGPGRGPEG